MPIPLDPATFILLSEVPHLLPVRPNGRKVHVSAVYRWACKGVRGVRLQTVRIAGVLYTSHEAVEDFINASAQPPEERQPIDRLAERRQAIAAARLAIELGLVDSRDRRPSQRGVHVPRRCRFTSAPDGRSSSQQGAA